jgi:hypothetical protein
LSAFKIISNKRYSGLYWCCYKTSICLFGILFFISLHYSLNFFKMAKVKFGIGPADIRGKINGSVFARNRGGAYVRTKVTPLNPQTSAQVAARSLLTGLAQNFRSLSQDQITAWNNAVTQWQTTDVFGDLVSPTGLALYVRLNANIQNGGGTPISTPPSPVGASALTDLALVADVSSSQFDVAFSPSSVPANHSLYIESTSMLSPGINNANSRFRFIAVEATGGASPVDVFTAQTTKFGALVAGQKVYVRCKFINTLTGEVSLALKASTIVTA